ncbi:hypothetical protein C6503_06690 [Candidatus Poribacteria bacterium]|nr:MAG: hypothetical protein C6503_06690 [Candidatus Poribacteria bacterium]
MPVFSFEPSGGVLVLDGEDDYAILPLAEHGYIFPKNTDEFTVEVWFYPKSRPELGENNIILSQQVAFGLLIDDRCQGRIRKKNEVCSYGSAHLVSGELRGVTGINAVIKKDQWNYLAVIFKDSTFHLAYNDQIVRGQPEFMNAVAPELRVREQFKSFFIGGYAEDALLINRNGQVLGRKTHFHGEIDVVRFSNIARYDLPGKPGFSPFDPPHRFFTDAHTLALWDFNEKEGADRFEDTSGNGKTLVGMNGATTIGGTGVNLNRNPEGEVEMRQDEDELEIRPDNSLATTWGQVKSESF